MMSPRIFMLIIAALTASCTSTKGEKIARELCYCGPAALEPASCGVWSQKSSIKSQPIELISKIESPSCTSSICSENFSQFCRSISMWPHPTQNVRTAEDACFCDFAWIRQGNRSRLVCASWQQGSRQLLEYYSSSSCEPTSCGKAPFKISQKVCPKGFVSFYPISHPQGD